MARKPAGNVSRNRRGSPEAIAKRRAGRAFNVLLDLGTDRRRLDGRSQKRRQRLLGELSTGRARGSRQPLKPLDILSRISELLDLGESPAAIRKVRRPHPLPADRPSLTHVVAQLHRAYEFRPDAYRLMGIDDDLLRKAGVI